MKIINKINKIDNIDKIFILDIIIIVLLFCNVFESLNLLLILVDALCSFVLIIYTFKEINNSENKIKSMFKQLIVLFTLVPYDLIGLYLSFFSNIHILKFLRGLRIIFKLFELKKRRESKFQKVMEQTNTVVVFNVVFTLLFVSIVLLCYFEHMSVLKSVYFVIVTFSSVGFGDVVAETLFGKIIIGVVSVLSIFGVGFLSTFCLTYVQFNEEKETELAELKKQNEKIIKLLEKRGL